MARSSPSGTTSAAGAADRFAVVPADCLLDLPAHPSPPASVAPVDPGPAMDFIKSTYQSERRQLCQEERLHFVQVCRDYLQKSFDARIRAAQDRVMALRQREQLGATEVAIARQRAENDLTDLKRIRQERMAGLDRLAIARTGPVRHIATALVIPAAGTGATADFTDELEPELNRESELAAEDVVVAYEKSRGWECERVGHLKIGFDIRSQGPADPRTGYRDPVKGIRRIEVKGRKKGATIRLTVNEWYRAVQLGDSYWLYVGLEPAEPAFARRATAGRQPFPQPSLHPESGQASGPRQEGGRGRTLLRRSRRRHRAGGSASFQ